MGKRAASGSKTDGKTDLAPIRPVEGATVRSETGHFVVTDRGLGAVEAGAAAGVSINGLAALLGISRETLRQARERQPEVDAALARGLASFEAELVSYLVRDARGGYSPGAMFLLKARLGWREGDAPEQRPSVVINLPDALSPAAYLDMLAKRQRAVLEGESNAEPRTTLTR